MRTKTGETISVDAAFCEIRELITNRFRGKPIRIYEAGGGSMSVLPLSSLNDPAICVVDIDETQLRNNNYAASKILGDIQTYSFPPNSFDLVVCYNVIEHLDFVDQAIRQFYNALAPGGLLFIGAPHPESFSGLVTRFSPHWFHVWFYRVILRRRNAGQPGQPPFRTVYHPLVSPKALLDFSAKLGFETIYFAQYSSKNYTSLRETRPMLGWLVYAATSVMNALSFGRRDFRNGDYHVLFEKRGAATVSPGSGDA